MSRIGEEDEVPPKFDEEGNPINTDEGSKLGACNAPTTDDLMKKLEKLKAKNKKLRAKEKKTKVCSSKKGGKGRKPDKPSYNYMSFNYNTCHLPPLILPYPLVKLPALTSRTITNGSIA
jgi:hypothetical protein